MAKLYIVSTPIGNLEDISIRAKRILQEVKIIACEDTRHTGLLLQKLGISPHPQLISFYDEIEQKRTWEMCERLAQGEDIALVSDAGTPLVSDPGYKLVSKCLELGIKVVPIPGPSAVLAALVSAGLPTDKFLFLGYLPQKANKAKQILDSMGRLEVTIIIYEGPHRLIKTLQLIQEILGDISLTVCSELTKVFEKTETGKISDMVAKLENQKPKGEFTILWNLKV